MNETECLYDPGVSCKPCQQAWCCHVCRATGCVNRCSVPITRNNNGLEEN